MDEIELKYRESRFFYQGWESYSMGKSINECPYDLTLERIEFMTGWITAMNIEDLKNPLFDGTKREVK